ncbi:MAG: hypothetical protein EZS28_033701 [Streblomastix strix]|uniref:Right handed beta helix domain-containing protein n=1 Tax=Streblomastix strix TaxID=222440 RepID=A0A5J4UL66_9EUKA|nr:MAG: hypothetical protein EZS28_033701 [Streblomastix strix]
MVLAPTDGTQPNDSLFRVINGGELNLDSVRVTRIRSFTSSTCNVALIGSTIRESEGTGIYVSGGTQLTVNSNSSLVSNGERIGSSLSGMQTNVVCNGIDAFGSPINTKIDININAIPSYSSNQETWVFADQKNSCCFTIRSPEFIISVQNIPQAKTGSITISTDYYGSKAVKTTVSESNLNPCDKILSLEIRNSREQIIVQQNLIESTSNAAGAQWESFDKFSFELPSSSFQDTTSQSKYSLRVIEYLKQSQSEWINASLNLGEVQSPTEEEPVDVSSGLSKGVIIGLSVGIPLIILIIVVFIIIFIVLYLDNQKNKEKVKEIEQPDKHEQQREAPSPSQDNQSQLPKEYIVQLDGSNIKDQKQQKDKKPISEEDSIRICGKYGHQVVCQDVEQLAINNQPKHSREQTVNSLPDSSKSKQEKLQKIKRKGKISKSNKTDKNKKAKKEIDNKDIKDRYTQSDERRNSKQSNSNIESKSFDDDSTSMQSSEALSQNLLDKIVGIRAGRKSRIVPDFPGFQNLRHGQSRVLKCHPGLLGPFCNIHPGSAIFQSRFVQLQGKLTEEFKIKIYYKYSKFMV